MKYDNYVFKLESASLSRLRELLRTEKFRQALIREDIADDYVLGFNGHSAVSGTVGCCKNQQNRWEVYEVNDDGEQYKIRFFKTQMAAFRDAARRRGYYMPQSDLQIDNAQDYKKLASNEQETLDSAIKFLSNLAAFYSGSRYGTQVQNDLRFLKDIKKSIRSQDMSHLTDTCFVAAYTASGRTLPKQHLAFSAPKRAALYCSPKHKNSRAVAKQVAMEKSQRHCYKLKAKAEE